MRVIARTGREDIAVVYVADMGDNRRVEFVESLQPPIPREKKWVLIVSTLYGCPIQCRFCDAGLHYGGRLSAGDMIAQIDYAVTRRFPDRAVPSEKFKIQFARMGEPAFNERVIDVLSRLPELYDAPGLMPAVSTIAPAGTDRFFERLLETKRDLYGGRFQLQFSIHTTDDDLRNWLVPSRKWAFDTIAAYGERFFEEGDRKIALNFALTEGMPIDAAILRRYFPSDLFLIKLTPVNPTFQAERNRVVSLITSDADDCDVVGSLREAGYEVIVSIGELEENHIGSNCGQYLLRLENEAGRLEGGYTYKLEQTAERSRII